MADASRVSSWCEYEDFERVFLNKMRGDDPTTANQVATPRRRPYRAHGGWTGMLGGTNKQGPTTSSTASQEKTRGGAASPAATNPIPLLRV